MFVNHKLFAIFVALFYELKKKKKCAYSKNKKFFAGSIIILLC